MHVGECKLFDNNNTIVPVVHARAHRALIDATGPQHNVSSKKKNTIIPLTLTN